jgi:farnesyl-diphosphate farnesyltransferase
MSNNIEQALHSFGIDSNSQTCKDPWGYSAFMLSQVSRTFALNIKVLPTPLRKRVLLAYLFCRMADTLEDDPDMTGQQKADLLAGFANLFKSDSLSRSNLGVFILSLPQSFKTSDDFNHYLLINALWPLELFFEENEINRKAISSTVIEMCSGMAKYSLKKEERANGWTSIENLAELDDYCYYVAGTVGNMLCDLFKNYSALISEKQYAKMKKLAVSFGLGLQITNIIKDVGEDSLREICFLPESLAQKEGLTTKQLFEPAHLNQSKRVIQTLILKASDHLKDALDYSLLIPRLEPRLRLFCLWPLFMATATLVEAGDGARSFNDPASKIKISRSQVKSILKNTSWFCWSNIWLKKSFIRDYSTIQASIQAG